MQNQNNFNNLDPNIILEIAEKNGFSTTGELIQLNSYENRVFEIKLEKNNSSNTNNKEFHDALIAKFYRPNRWSAETIQDELNFTNELRTEGLKVAGTFSFGQLPKSGINFALFEKVRGRLLQELQDEHYKKIGRWLAQLHNVGSRKPAKFRSHLGPSNDDKWSQLNELLDRVSPEVAKRYESASYFLFEELDNALKGFDFIRVHGDLHRGNLLEDSSGDLALVDFDDMINGPAVQDFWMLLPSSDHKNCKELDLLMNAYTELRQFPESQLDLIPLLRGYRIITYAIWIMRRWSDPSFPKLFPLYDSYSYWAEETESLERIAFSL